MDDAFQTSLEYIQFVDRMTHVYIKANYTALYKTLPYIVPSMIELARFLFEAKDAIGSYLEKDIDACGKCKTTYVANKENGPEFDQEETHLCEYHQDMICKLEKFHRVLQGEPEDI